MTTPFFMSKNQPLDMTMNISRRRFVTGLASTTALSMLGASTQAQTATTAARFYQPQPELSGSKFKLDIGYKPVNFTGQTKQAFAVNTECQTAACQKLGGGESHWYLNPIRSIGAMTLLLESSDINFLRIQRMRLFPIKQR